MNQETPLSEVQETARVCSILNTYDALLSLLRTMPMAARANALGQIRRRQDPEFTTKAEYKFFEACRDVAVE